MTDYIWTPETDADRENILRQMLALRAEDDAHGPPPAMALPDYYLPDPTRVGGVIVRFPGLIG